ncbi:hypothetical protein [Kocuria massiliensis]|uniref:hypothetical protein n=1 Tax=Kocuria massiliensis TaxID=1926282 RepID=UPI0022B9C242|nr:hypothetical protein [Kocuria massiliensis]
MVQTPIVAVVAHHTRHSEAVDLMNHVNGATLFVDDDYHGSLWNHRRALQWADSIGERVWIMEDDAVPDRDFAEHAHHWATRYPNELISGYLGRSRPPQWQHRIESLLAHGDDHVRLPQLIHGVCYSIPPEETGRVLAGLQDGPADYAIGDAWDRDVLYTVPSLVDHADGEPVEKHPDGTKRTPGRTAWVPPLKTIKLK